MEKQLKALLLHAEGKSEGKWQRKRNSPTASPWIHVAKAATNAAPLRDIITSSKKRTNSHPKGLL